LRWKNVNMSARVYLKKQFGTVKLNKLMISTLPLHNVCHPVAYSTQERTKLLQRCCLSSRPQDALKLVTKLGVPLSAVCKHSKETVLHWACQRGDKELIAFVLQVCVVRSDFN
jgi:hypothetical protein